MLPIPPHIARQYSIYLEQKASQHQCIEFAPNGWGTILASVNKYSRKQEQKSDLKAFMEKLEEKGQGLNLRRQAYRAVSLFHEMNSLDQANNNEGLFGDRRINKTCGTFQYFSRGKCG